MRLRFFALAVLALALSACAARAVRTAPAPQIGGAHLVVEDAWLQREMTLRGQTTWSFTGRIAIRDGREGGSGRIEWSQSSGKTEVVLSAPLTRQSWQLTIDENGARLDGLAGGSLSGPDAAALLRQATGIAIPVVLLGAWVRGVMTDKHLKTASWETDDQSRLSHLEQDGWVIDYQWPAQRHPGEVWMPSRIDASKGQARVRLIIDQWTSP